MIPKEKIPYYLEWTDDSGSMTRFYPDAQLSEEVSLTALVTRHPIENGADITDHYRSDETNVDVEWVVTNEPIRGDLSNRYPGRTATVELKYAPAPEPSILSVVTPGGLNRTIQSVFDQRSLPDSIQTLVFDAPPNRGGEAIQICEDIRDNARLVTVSTGVKIYEGMALTRVGFRRDATSSKVTLNLSFSRVNLVESDVSVALPLEPRGQATKKAGTQGTETHELSDAERKSILRRTFDAVGINKLLGLGG